MAHASSGAGNLFAPVSGLAALAAELAELPIGPSESFRDRLRSDLLDEATRRADARFGAASSSTPADLRDPIPRSGPAGRRLGRRLAAAGVVAALTAGGVSAAAAGHAIPGDALYPMKRFGESVRTTLDPGAGSGPALHLLSTRIGEVESIAAMDPTGAQPERWTGADAALRDANAALTSAIALEPPAGLRPDLTSSRARLARLLLTVPEAHRPGVQTLLDEIDGLPGAFSAGADFPALPYGLLPPGRLNLGRALSDGWPIDPALALPAPPPAATPIAAALPSAPTGSSGSTTGTAGNATSGGSGSGSSPSSAASTSPLSRVSGRSSSPSSLGTTSGSASTGDRTGSAGTGVGGVVGRTTSSAAPRAAGSAVSGATDVASGAVGDATDAVNRLPRIVSPAVSSTTKRLTSGLTRTP
jgi:hypothetical protein